MSLAITKTPALYSLASNPVEWSIETSEATGSFYRINLQVWDNDNSVLISEDSIEPDADLTATFDISLLLQALFLTYSFNYIFTDIIRKTDFLKSYFVRYFETYFDETEVTGDDYDSSVYYALNGRLQDIYDQRYRLIDSSYYEDVIEKKLFLTLQPRIKTIDVYQIERLYFLNHNYYVSSITLNVELFFSDNTQSVHQLNTILAETSSIYEISTGYKELELSDYETETRLITKYTVWLTAQDDSIVSEQFTYNIDRKKSKYTRYFIFRNRVGGYDTVRLKGIITSQNEIENTIGSTYSGNIKTGVSISETLTANTGVLSTAENYYIQEIFESSEAWEICSEGIFSIILKNTKSESREGNRFLFDQTLEYTRESIVLLFTPDNDPIQIYGDYSFLDYSSDYNI